MTEILLEIKDLGIQFITGEGTVQPIRGVNFSLKKGETLGVVGESGSILFNNQDITRLREREYRKLRGNEISMIFQEPMTSLNPVFTIGEQLSEPLKQHKRMSKNERKEAIINVLKQVGIPRAEQIINEYPHQLSGGMRQRVMISLALLCEPKLLICDEPTTALDVTIQAQILELMKQIKNEKNMSLLFITHDLGVVAEMCDRVVVMYAGEIVEVAEINELFDSPLHPYTKGLIDSLPTNNARKSTLFSIKGQVPRPEEIGEGCAFANRCPHAFEKCTEKTPPIFSKGDHLSKCWLQESERQVVKQ